MSTLKKSLAALALCAGMLSGCGNPDALMGSVSPMAMGGQRPTPPAVALQRLAVPASARDYGQLQQIQNDATNALYSYMNLVNQWNSTPSQSQKDQLEQQMLTVLTSGCKRVQYDAQQDAYDSQAQQAENTATQALYQYSSLRNEWSSTSDVNSQRQIVNQMLQELTSALKQVQYETAQ